MSARMLALASRYGALAAQFLVVVLVARQLPRAAAGSYLLLSGLVATSSVAAGLGAPDGLVKTVTALLAADRKREARGALLAAAGFTAATGLAIVAVAAVAALLRHVGGAVVTLVALWWLAAAALFFAGQALVALGRPTIGAFVFYAANNAVMLVIAVPYLLLSTAPSLAGTLAASTVTAWVAAAIGLAPILVELRRLPADGRTTAAWRSGRSRLGFTIALGRVFQSALYWVPAWAVGLVRGAADAAVFGAAGRLLIGATAVIAVLRFTLRGRIVAAQARGDAAAVEAMARSAAGVATLAALAALAAVLAAGAPVIVLLFGAGFREAAPILAVLLVGALGESIGGPVDEVLKYGGHARAVLVGLVAAVGGEAALSLVLAPFGLEPVAAAQAAAFCAMYGFQILYARRKLGILIVPRLG